VVAECGGEVHRAPHGTRRIGAIGRLVTRPSRYLAESSHRAQPATTTSIALSCGAPLLNELPE
jgi:hypothetical protein